MVSSEVWFQQTYVYIQATEPTDKAEGKLWYNTSNDKTYASDGTSYVDIANVDFSHLEQQNLEQDLNILINSAGASTTLNDYDDMFVDIFSDANGTDNTIDTGNTTAIFSIDNYNNLGGDGSPLDEAHGISFVEGAARTNQEGHLIHTNKALLLTKVTKHTSCTATKCLVYLKSSETLLATATFVGNDATFNFSLNNNEDYYIVAGESDFSSYTRYISADGTYYTYNKVNLNYVTGGFNTSGVWTEAVSRVVNILSIETEELLIADKIVQTNAITVDTAQAYHQLYCHNSVAGSGSVTYDISFDNGLTWDTGQALNTKNARTSTTGTQMITKLNLNGTGTGNTSEASDYAVMLFY